ncbi:MAG: ABC transporter ATP-binding protein [Candidatus Bathyarchaeia archaeon]
MPTVELRNVSNSYILRNVNLRINSGELLALLGPMGTGKTTLLNVVAGLIPYDGTVLFDGASVDALPPDKRRIGYVFQNPVLFPHLDVASNVSFGLKVQRRSKGEIEDRLNEVLKLLKIEHLKHRHPEGLSGGERQRVSLAQALAKLPEVLLLDEPFNNLDPTTRNHLRIELRELQKILGVTTIFVTHNLNEAEEIANRIAVIIDGEIQQVGTAREIFADPKNEMVADFMGSRNILNCLSSKILGHGLAEVDCGGLRVVVPYEGTPIERIAIYPGNVHLSVSPPPGPSVNLNKGIIKEIIPYSPFLVRLKVKVRDVPLLAEMAKEIFDSLGLSLGKELFVKLRIRDMRVYSKDHGD